MATACDRAGRGGDPERSAGYLSAWHRSGEAARGPAGSERNDRLRSATRKKTVVLTCMREAAWPIHGVDFTSRPSPMKPITVASGRRPSRAFRLDAMQEFPDWPGFESWLRRPVPWIAGFDFPLGLPREAINDLGLPQQYPQ